MSLLYTIAGLNEITESRINASVQNNLDDLRVSNDGTKYVLKFNTHNGIPNEFEGCTIYTIAEIKTQMALEAWTITGA